MSNESILRLRAGLKNHFGPDAVMFVDVVLWTAGMVSVDILRLDYWLKKKHPDYGEESMRGFIKRQYGEEAELFIAHWVKGERRDEKEKIMNENITILVMALGAWGRGKTYEEAKTICIREGGKQNAANLHIVYACTDPDCYVNSRGGIEYRSGAVLTKIVAVRFGRVLKHK